jgi:hypothetical protein
METQNKKVINLEKGFMPALARFQGKMASAIREVRDPICGSYGWLENFKEGINMYNYQVRQAKIARSIILENDAWKYDGRIATFKKTEDYHVAIVLPKDYHPKYIVGKTDTGRQVILALPADLHREIKSSYEKLTGEKVHSIAGGRIKKENGKLILYGRSVDYGPANHEVVSELLTKLGFPADAEAKK